MPPSHIFVMDSDGTGVTQLTAGKGDTVPRRSADGTHIMFSSMGAASWDICTMRADGTELKQVIATQANEWNADWLIPPRQVR